MAITVSNIASGPNQHATSSEEANGLATDFFAPGVVGAVTNSSGVAPMTGGFALSATGTNNQYTVGPGVGYVLATPNGQGSQLLRVKNASNITMTVSSNATGSTRYDWVYIAVDPALSATPDTAGDNVGTIFVSRATNNTTDDGTPPSFGTVIGVVTVAPNFVNIANGNLTDKRYQTHSSKKLSLRRTTSVSHSTSGTNVPWNGFPGPYSIYTVAGRDYEILMSEGTNASGLSATNAASVSFLVDGVGIPGIGWLYFGNGQGFDAFGYRTFTATKTGWSVITAQWSSSANGSPATYTYPGLGILVIRELG